MHSLETIYFRNTEQVKLAYKRAILAQRYAEAVAIRKANPGLFPQRVR